MQLPAFTPKRTWFPPETLPDWKDAKRVCVDVETRDPSLKKLGPGVRRDGYVVGIGFAIEDGPACYLPIRHKVGQNMETAAVLQYLRKQAESFTGEIVGANLQYDMDYLEQENVSFQWNTWRDVQIAEPLIDENQFTYSLDAIAERYGVAGKDESMLAAFASAFGVDPKSGLWQLPPHAVGAYAEQDVRLPLALLRRQERKLDREGLFPVFDLECALQKVLLKMRRRGVAIDFDKLSHIETVASQKETESLSEITRLTGIGLTPADTNRPASWANVLRHLGIRMPKTKTGKDSVTTAVLQGIKHPVGDLIRTTKKWNKLRTTFVASIRAHAVNGRVHCTFNQLRRPSDDVGGDEKGARYGRLSCTGPNLQQQPARDREIGPLWRSIYVPDDGGEWCCADYSQQEPRWLTHYAELCKLPRAAEMAERYRTDPTTDNHDMMATLINPGWPEIADKKAKKKERDDAKQIFLAICYGMGGGKLCSSLGLPTATKVHAKSGESYLAAGPEGQALIDKFDAGVPFVRALAKRVERKASRYGFILTAGGRKCRFPLQKGGGYDWTYKALNRLIQGSSGDQMKTAMVEMDRAGINLQLQVHDEVDLTIGSRSEADEIVRIMRNALLCNVPAKVDVEIGPSWGEIE